MTTDQRTAIPAALQAAADFADANGLTPDLVTYMTVREQENGSGNFAVILHTTDPSNYEVDVYVAITPEGAVSGPRGLDTADAWSVA